MTGIRVGVCSWCGTTFEAPAAKGPLPRYCRASHRQRAYESRVGRRPPTTGLADANRELDAALDRLAAALAHPGRDHTADSNWYHQVTAAAQAVITASGRRLAPGPRPADRPSPVTVTTSATVAPSRPGGTATSDGAPEAGRSQTRPWIVVRHPSGSDPRSPLAVTLTAHRSPAAAGDAARRLAKLWYQRQGSERDRWTFTAVAGADRTVARQQLSLEAAQQWVQQLQVAVADPQVVYDRRPHRGSPAAVIVERVHGRVGEPLNLRWQRPPGGYPLPTNPRTRLDAHPYLNDLLHDACQLAYLTPRPHCPQLHTVAADFAAEVLDPLGETWTLSATSIQTWLQHRNIITLIPNA